MHRYLPAKNRVDIELIYRKLGPSGLRLLSIDPTGGLPRALIEVAQKVSKADALALVQACYQQKIEQMRKEIEGLIAEKESLLQVISQKVLPPYVETQQKNKDSKNQREGMIEPKPPEICQNLLWLKKYGRKHSKFLSFVVFILLCIWILPKINLFSWLIRLLLHH